MAGIFVKDDSKFYPHQLLPSSQTSYSSSLSSHLSSSLSSLSVTGMSKVSLQQSWRTDGFGTYANENVIVNMIKQNLLS